MWYKNVGMGFFRFVAVQAFDRHGQTDGQKDHWKYRACITCSRTVKTVHIAVVKLKIRIQSVL